MEVEWLILADWAQVIGNKLYVQGGGWDKLTVNSGFPTNHAIGIGASFRVPWNETNQLATAEIEVLTDDGASVAKIEGQFKVGRPADHPPGQEQRTQIAANITLKLERAGTYAVVARLEGQEQGRTHFNVVPGPLLAMKQQQERSGGGDMPEGRSDKS
jgi:Family of unknown function (DUF6941)